ncbi:hypothetical protein LQW54_004716 [Pestalotiopsis sp. IQ-011]
MPTPSITKFGSPANPGQESCAGLSWTTNSSKTDRAMRGSWNTDLGRYLAGLWEKTLLRDLFWRPKNNRSEARLGQWRAPSWSWASQTAPVEFLVKYNKHFACDVISLTCDTKNPRDHYGEIDPDGEATLTIRAPIVDVVMEYKLDADLEEETRNCFGIPPARNRVLSCDVEKKHLGVCVGMSSLDIEPDTQFARDVPSGSTVQLLMLTRMEGTAWDLGFLLAPSPTHPGKHMRIGTFMAMYGWSWQIPVDLWSVRKMRTMAIV